MSATRRLTALLVLAGLVGSAATFDAVAQTKPKDKEPPKTAKAKDAAAKLLTFEVYKDEGDKYRFRLRDGNDQLLAMANKGYETKADCLKVIDTIKKEVGRAKTDDQAK